MLQSVDANIRALAKLFAVRSQVGIRKYILDSQCDDNNIGRIRRKYLRRAEDKLFDLPERRDLRLNRDITARAFDQQVRLQKRK